jgi:hypothetical protein
LCCLYNAVKNKSEKIGCAELIFHQVKSSWPLGKGFYMSLFYSNFFSDSQDQFSPEDSNDGNSTINSTAESTVAIVQLEAIDAFCKLMLDMNLGWVKSGQQAGLPPTIIATESFLNAVLKSLNVSESYM